ncbi:hypothetical protein KHA80_02940 [Anaerobacillus sp. HL2]|nr:hypothetical protein KHA80_02940 [Anaerobacillus sp. HL2]
MRKNKLIDYNYATLCHIQVQQLDMINETSELVKIMTFLVQPASWLP